MDKNKRKLMERIWVEYHSRLQIYLKQLFPDLKDTEERVSEILFKIFDRLDSYNPRYALSTWVYMLARTIQLDEFRKKNLKTVPLEDSIPVDSETPESLFFAKEKAESLQKALDNLSPEDKEITFLFYYENLRIKEISEVTQKPAGTVKYRLMRIREILKEELLQEKLHG